MSKFFCAAIAFLVLSHADLAEAQAEPTPISLFGTKPIQLSVDKDGITRKEGGYICRLPASLGGAEYSEWGETEKDARTIVMKKCSDKSGVLICKDKNITCQQDK